MARLNLADMVARVNQKKDIELKVDQIAAAVGPAGITPHFLSEVDSTNNWAKANLNDSDPPLPALVYTEQQTAGRGRNRNRWFSDSGSLTFSFVGSVQPAAGEKSDFAQLPLFSIASACVVQEVLANLLHSVSKRLDIQIKWPNDVLLNGKKCCGILIETVPGFMDRLVIGIGINVNSSVKIDASQELIQPTSLSAEYGRFFDRSAILTECAMRLAQVLSGDFDRSLVGTWFEKFDFLRDKEIEIETPRHTVRGVACGLDSQGGLQIKVGPDIKTIYSGSVVSVEV